jgi:hypothetical protein
MSGYAYKTSYDATIKRKQYLQELALRAKLDDVNLQANKIYKRTGAVSTPPDTRTTTEKLADLYRLRIDMRSKLGQLMSGDDAQKVVNELDQQELIFLTQRIDKFITELKPKYALGVPYQVFNTYFKNAIRDFNRFGELDATRTVLEELSSNTDETKYAIETLTREIQLAGKKEIIFKLENIDKLRNLIDRASYLLNEGAIDPTLQTQVSDAIQAIENSVPTKPDLVRIQSDFEKAVRSGDTRTQDKLAKQVLDTAVDVDTLGNNIDDLERIIQETTQQLPQVPIGTQIPLKSVANYEKPYDPKKWLKVDEVKDVFQLLLEKAYGKPTKNPTIPPIPFVADIFRNKLLPSLMNEGMDASRIRSGSTLYQKMRGDLGWGIDEVNEWIYDNDDDFRKIFAIEAREVLPYNPFSELSAGSADIYGGLSSTFNVSNPTGISSGLVSTPVAQPAPQPSPQPPPQPAPQPAQRKNVFASARTFFFKQTPKVDISTIIGEITNEDASFTEDIIKNQINDITTEPEFNIYKADPNDRELLFGYIREWLNFVLTELSKKNQPQSFVEFVREKIRTSTTGKGLKGKKSRMKGKGVAIDLDAGMIADGERKSNYVPFGKFIINRNKLNDGIIMIKRPNGAFMGELQSRRVGSKLKNVFEKIVGGSVPSYNDYNKLDADEIEYLHFVAKKSNLLDKLDVPTPKKDDDEKMMNRFEVLRGQLMAGNDNKQMISEFKKLILDMADKKLLPRRQVSDILIDIERMY